MRRTEMKAQTARSCYGHLGGKLGSRLFARLIELGWFELDDERTTAYRITEKGRNELVKLGVSLEESGRTNRLDIN